MIHDPYSTATMTKTVSGTKLAVATLAMFVAGGAAFAVSPLNTAGEKFSCSDSDGGHQVYEFGTARQVNRKNGNTKAEKSDFCTIPTGRKPSKLTEFTCTESGVVQSSKQFCPSGTQCVDGVCRGESATSTSGLPDLVIKDVGFQISEDPENRGIEVFVAVSNIGNSASIPTRVFVMPSPTASRTADIGSILPGQTQVVSIVVGDLVTSVNVSVDGEGNVEESNESNNELNNVPVVLSGSSTSTTSTVF